MSEETNDYKEEKGGVTTIEATDPKSERSVSVVYDFGSTSAEAVEKFGDKVVLSNFIGKSVITAQAIIRRAIRAGKTDEEIKEIFTTWKPGVAIERSFDPLSATLNKFDTMTPEEQQKFLADLKSKLK